MARSTDITFAAIVRDGAESIAACLQSVRHIADEMIVVDTGSRDGTAELAEKLGAHVIRSAWQQDFAAARNKYLAAARCSWILSLDCDEVLHPCTREDLQPFLLKSSTAWLFRVNNYFPIALFGNGLSPEQWSGEVVPGIGCTTSSTVRLFPNHREVRYCYPIHESLGPSLKNARLKVEPCPLPIHHFGYLKGESANRSKAAAYKILGEKKIREFPDYFLGHLEMGKILAAEKDWNRAETFLRTAVRLNPAYSESHYELARSVLKQGRLVECERILTKAIRRFPQKLDLYYLLGQAQLLQGQAQKAVECFTSVLIAKPEHCSTWFHLVDAYSELNQPETCENLLQMCLPAQETLSSFADHNDGDWKSLVHQYAKLKTELTHRKQTL
jgi:glycosyltransferase involved in cell wall biosynthesis